MYPWSYALREANFQYISFLKITFLAVRNYFIGWANPQRSMEVLQHCEETPNPSTWHYLIGGTSIPVK